jgi:hypothetical protein
VGQVDLYVRLRSQRLKDDVTPVAQLRLFDRDLPGLDEPLHERLILRDLDGHAISHQIRPAVSDLREVQGVAEETGDRRRGTHAAKLGMVAGVMVDRRVRDLRGRLQGADEGDGFHRLCVAPPSTELLQHDLHRHLARDLARGGTAHSVRDHEQRSAVTGPLRSQMVE